MNNFEGKLIFDEKYANSFVKIDKKQVILVYIVGGLTYGEITALRYIGKAYSKNGLKNNR